MTIRTFPIHHTFGPLVTPEQRSLAFMLQFQPWKWRDGTEREELRNELSNRFGRSVSLFARGRDGLFATMRALGLKTGEEVIIQGYTCVVVPNAIHAAQGVAVYADIEPETLSLHVEKIQRYITPRTRAIICQHTFGIPADTKKLRAICDKRNLILIEDCAHVIPDDIACETKRERPVGIHGDVILFSFGRDKAISGVSGGAVLTHNPQLAEAIARAEREAAHIPPWRILPLIDYPLHYTLAKKVWSSGLAKPYLVFLRSLKMLTPILTPEEKHGRTSLRIGRMPNACAALALQQWRSLKALNDHRRTLSRCYIGRAKAEGWQFPAGISEDLPLQKFPLFIKDPLRIREKLKSEEIYLDDGWCGAVVNPRSVDQVAAGYGPGISPVAEDIAAHILTLPTHPTTTLAQAEYAAHAVGSLLAQEGG